MWGKRYSQVAVKISVPEAVIAAAPEQSLTTVQILYAVT